jgi:hypothetical protein
MAQKFDNHMIFRIVLIVLAAFVLFTLINYYNSKQQTNVRNTEKFYQDAAIQQKQTLNNNTMMSQQGSPKVNPALANEQQSNSLIINKKNTDSIRPAEDGDNSDFRAVDFKSSNLPSDCFPRDRLSAEDLLPADAANSKWAQVNPAGQGDVSNQNFLTAGWAVGINTISGSLRNANLQLRSEPPNPKGAWPIMNSTISPDLMRRPLEIAGDCGL